MCVCVCVCVCVYRHERCTVAAWIIEQLAQQHVPRATTQRRHLDAECEGNEEEDTCVSYEEEGKCVSPRCRRRGRAPEARIPPGKLPASIVPQLRGNVQVPSVPVSARAVTHVRRNARMTEDVGWRDRGVRERKKSCSQDTQSRTLRERGRARERE